MHKIKIMLASRPKMISDIIWNIIDKQPDMMMIGEVYDPIRLLYVTKQTEVDVVIVTPLRVNAEPKICSHLLKENPNLTVITLSAKGKAAYLYQKGVPRLRISEPCPKSILCAIRKASK